MRVVKAFGLSLVGGFIALLVGLAQSEDQPDEKLVNPTDYLVCGALVGLLASYVPFRRLAAPATGALICAAATPQLDRLAMGHDVDESALPADRRLWATVGAVAGLIGNRLLRRRNR